MAKLTDAELPAHVQVSLIRLIEGCAWPHPVDWENGEDLSATLVADAIERLNDPVFLQRALGFMEIFFSRRLKDPPPDWAFSALLSLALLRSLTEIELASEDAVSDMADDQNGS